MAKGNSMCVRGPAGAVNSVEPLAHVRGWININHHSCSLQNSGCGALSLQSVLVSQELGFTQIPTTLIQR